MAAKKVAKKPVKKPASKATPAAIIYTAKQKLDILGLDTLCARLTNGESQKAIAVSLGIDQMEVGRWIAADDLRSARTREARAASARHWDEEAVNALVNADEDKPGAIAKARELASHYRWRSKCYAPKEYGDKLDMTAAVTVSLTEDQLKAKAATLMSRLGFGPSK